MPAAQELSHARSLHTFLSVGVGLVLAVALAVRHRGGAQPQLEQAFLLVSAVLLLACLAGALLLPKLISERLFRRIASGSWGTKGMDDASMVASSFLARSMVGWGLIEAAALFEGATVLVTGSAIAAGPMAALFLALVAMAPRRERFERWVQDGVREVERLRQQSRIEGQP